MKWFGESWGAPVNESAEHVDTPVGWPCVYCRIMIVEADAGFITPYISDEEDVDEVAFHHECFLKDLGIALVVAAEEAAFDRHVGLGGEDMDYGPQHVSRSEARRLAVQTADKEKNAECLDCAFQWHNVRGDRCPNCGSTDIAHLA